MPTRHEEAVNRFFTENYARLVSWRGTGTYPVEAVHDAWISIYKRADEIKFDDLPLAARFGYVYAVLRNKGIQQWRDQREVQLPESVPEPRIACAPSAPGKVLRRELNDAIATLPDRERTAILMTMEGYTADEIAHVLGTSVENAYQILHRARRKLRKLFKDFN